MKALIPAAGLGTRWFPWSHVIPKELLPLGNYPAIHYVLEEVVLAGIGEIGIIINKTKGLIREYVEEIWKSGHPEFRVTWFYQSSPRGVADALLCASEWVRDESTAVLYPDEIHPPKGGLVQLRHADENYHCNWIGLTAEKQSRRQAVLEMEEIQGNCFLVRGISNQNKVSKIGYSTGRYILGSGLEYLINYLLKTDLERGKELDDTNIFSPLLDLEIRGTILYEPIFDIGTPENMYSIFSTLNIQRFAIP